MPAARYQPLTGEMELGDEWKDWFFSPQLLHSRPVALRAYLDKVSQSAKLHQANLSKHVHLVP